MVWMQHSDAGPCERTVRLAQVQCAHKPLHPCEASGTILGSRDTPEDTKNGSLLTDRDVSNSQPWALHSSTAEQEQLEGSARGCT